MQRTIGTVILIAGGVLTAYAAIAFWLLKSLPPDGGHQGRLPSLYLLFTGFAVMLVGLVVLDFRVGKPKANR